jgi:hypothetical protein
MSETPWQTTLDYQCTLLKNEGQEGKPGPFQAWEPVEEGQHKERMNEDKYSGCILHSCVKTE